jgi:cytochrome c2
VSLTRCAGFFFRVRGRRNRPRARRRQPLRRAARGRRGKGKRQEATQPSLSFLIKNLNALSRPHHPNTQQHQKHPDVARGEKIFKTKCAQCHVAEKGGGHKQGPNLGGIFGRVSGTTEGFAYSKANKEKAVTWDEAQLYDYLLNPKK